MNQSAAKVYQVCDRRRGQAPDADFAARSLGRSHPTGETSWVAWINVVAFDRAQAIRIAGDYMNLEKPAAMSWPAKSMIGCLSVEEIIALHIDSAPCIVGPDDLPEPPEGTIVTLIANACDLGKVLAVLELDEGATVVGWVQNAPKVSREVEITIVAPFLPAMWQHADVTLSWRWLEDGAVMDWRIEPHCIRGRVRKAEKVITRHCMLRTKVEEYLK